MTFWETVWAHVIAILIGGVKVLVVGWAVWWLMRKKLIKRLVRDMMGELGPAAFGQSSQEPVPYPSEAECHGPLAKGAPIPLPPIGAIQSPFIKFPECPACLGVGVVLPEAEKEKLRAFRAAMPGSVAGDGGARYTMEDLAKRDPESPIE